MRMTISAASRLYGIHRSTLHRHIKSGRLSCVIQPDGSRALDLSELIRCYGEPPNAPEPVRQVATPHATGSATPDATGDATPSPDTLALLAELVEINRRQADQLEALTAKVERLEDAMRHLPAPGQLAPHPDDRPRHDEAPAAARPEADTAPRERHGDEAPARSFTDLLDKLNARAGS